MNKRKILLIQIAGCFALGTALGIAFWLFDGGKASECPGVSTNAQEMASVKVYDGKWHKDYLEVIK